MDIALLAMGGLRLEVPQSALPNGWGASAREPGRPPSLGDAPESLTTSAAVALLVCKYYLSST